MDHDIFLNSIGFSGNALYSLKYITRTRNLRYTWPHNNIFVRNKSGESLLSSVLKQPVGLDRSFAYIDKCSDIELILLKFYRKHKKTNYKLLLKKSRYLKLNKNYLQAAPRYVLKEYVFKLIHNIIPLQLFGTMENRIIFEKNVRKILCFSKSQVFSLSMLMHNVRTKNITYLNAVVGNINKTNLLAKLYLWLLRIYIFAAIKCVFYVTESNYSNKYLYYEKRVWQCIQQQCINRIKKKVVDLYKNCIITRTVLIKDIFILRILPKRRGSRPICVKWKRGMKKRSYISPAKVIKYLLFQFSEKHFHFTHTSSSVFHNNWSMLFFTWLSLSKPPVYFVRADFVDAFGSILQIKLIDMITRVIKENQHIQEIAFPYFKYKKKVSVIDAYNLVKKYISNFIFKNNKHVYKLTEGISQGGALSSVLCNFYFGELDLSYLTEFSEDKMGFLTRNCDDYLYVTLDRDRATKFLKRLENGFPDFNLHLNGTKTETNLWNSEKCSVSFSRYQLNVKSFQLYGCYKSYHNTSIFHNSAFRSVKQPGQMIMKRLLLLSTMKLDKIFLDSTYNTTYTILYNVFQASLLTAARCFAYVKFLFNHYNQSFVFKCAKNCAARIASTVQKKLAFNDGITSTVLQWIVFKAFIVRLRATRNEKRFAIVTHRIYNTLFTLERKCNSKELKVIENFHNIQQPAILRTIV